MRKITDAKKSNESGAPVFYC